ncbi:hypothetical protein BU23DRAFT_568820 [Bimuria novae-zelandiae CBS 107.79]|uniref:Uncharacterized protein n=1 Tax=Bimuria novae-zelandiae CBS 107.79 TaxID=1447943 RepID=A0A6A5VH39_9PLEO|nr:hypothetical protein BU23DRAFT_568820 [Bimuria novae-zelandiae CBS 107.79]
MASQSNPKPPESEPADGRSHPAPIADPFVLEYGDYGTNFTEEQLEKSKRLLLFEMGVPHYDPSASRPRDPFLLDDPSFNTFHVAANGRYEYGSHSPAFYQYEDELLGGTWQDGWDAIDAFDWGQPVSDKQDGEAQAESDLMGPAPAVVLPRREKSPADDTVQNVPVDTPMEVDDVQHGPLTSLIEVNFSAGSEHANPTPLGPSSPPRDEQDVPTLLASTPSTPRHDPSKLVSLSPPWILSPPAQVNDPSRILIAVAPLEPLEEEASSGDGHQTDLHTSLGGVDESGLTPPEEMIIDDPENVEEVHDAVEEEEGLQPVQSSDSVDGFASPSPVPDEAVTPSDAVADETNIIIKEGQVSSAVGDQDRIQAEISAIAHDESEREDLDSLHDGEKHPVLDDSRNAIATSDEIGVPSITTELVPERIATSSIELGVEAEADSQHSTDKATALPSSDRDVGADIVVPSPTIEQEDAAPVPVKTPVEATITIEAISSPPPTGDQEETAPKPLGTLGDEATTVAEAISSPPPTGEDEDAVSIQENTPKKEGPIASEAIDSPSTMAASVTGAGQMGQPRASTQVNTTEDSDIEGEHLLAPRDGSSADLSVDYAQLPPKEARHLGQAFERMILKGIDAEGEGDVALDQDTASVSSMEPSEPSSSESEALSPPLRLKIGSQLWNEASLTTRETNEEDASKAEDNPTALTAASELSAVKSEDATELFEKKIPSVGDFAPLEGSPIAAFMPAAEGSPVLSKQATPQPWLSALKEAAAAAPSSSSPTAMNHRESDRSSPWPGGFLEEQLLQQSVEQADKPPSPPLEQAPELPPSPFLPEPSTAVEKAKERDRTEPSALETPAEVSDLPEATKNSELTQGPTTPVFGSEGQIEATIAAESSAAEAPAKKRMRPTATRKAKAAQNATKAFSPEEASGSENEASANKKQKKNPPSKVAAKSSSFQAPTVASRVKSATKLAAPPKRQQAKRGLKQVVKDEELVDKEESESQGDEEDDEVEEYIAPLASSAASGRSSRRSLELNYGKRETRGEVKNRIEEVERRRGDDEEQADTNLMQGAVRTQEEEDRLVDVESDAVDDTASATKAKGKPKAKAVPVKAAPAKAVSASKAQPKTPAPKVTSAKAVATPRATRSKGPAKPASPTTPSTGASTSADAAAARNKFGFKAPTGRKRKAKEAFDTPETPLPDAGPLKRQTRQASAAQEEAERQAEVESNVAKRTRGAQKK